MTNTIEKFNQFHDEAEMMDRLIETEQDKIDYLKFRFGDKMLGEEIRELIQGIKDNDSHEILDGAGDVVFIEVNTLHFKKDKELRSFDIMVRRGVQYAFRYSKDTLNYLIKNCFENPTNNRTNINLSLTIMAFHLKELGYNSDEAIDHIWTILDRIADANLAKRHTDGKFHKVNGKIIKPDGWKEPRFDDIIGGGNVQ